MDSGSSTRTPHLSSVPSGLGYNSSIPTTYSPDSPGAPDVPTSAHFGNTMNRSSLSEELDSILKAEEEDRQSASLPDNSEMSLNVDVNDEEIIDTDDEDEEYRQAVEASLRDNEPKIKFVKRMTESRRQRAQGFDQWLKESVHTLQTGKENVEIDDNKLSTSALIGNAANVISDPREYQLELFEMAKQMNCLAVLDTGSGKTLIACLLIRHIINEELEARKMGKRRRVSFFLVDSVTLVFQQSSVLTHNIDAKVGKYYGDMCDSSKMWKPEVWEKILNEDMVLVMTADVLYNCLCRAFIRMKDINLLCFDEAHHAKKNHVYARIIKDFYLTEPETIRPKIFGMTASPVDARVDVVQAAQELETLLHSRIVTTQDLSLLQCSVQRPEERVMQYLQAKPPFETEFYTAMRINYGRLKSLGKVFAFAKQASSELGSWCSDLIWRFALSEEEAKKLARRTERIISNAPSNQIKKLEGEIAEILKAKEFVASWKFGEHQFTPGDSSDKILVLYRFLQSLYQESGSQKCIIFVKRRFTARCLFEILKEGISTHFHVGLLIGSRKGDTGDENFTIREQMLNVGRFKVGKLNCLIATSVAEEGLDVPDCNMVIRFDLYTTMIQYIQSRGRARHSNSKYYHMLECGNVEQLAVMRDCLAAEKTMRAFCQSLPEDRLLNERVSNAELEGLEPYYLEESTGSKLTLSSAMQVIATYTSNLEQDGDVIAQPTYIIRPAGGGQYICQLVLPSTSPMAAFESLPQKSKSLAKRAAAFEGCMHLRKNGYLNEHFLPNLRRKVLPKFANARLAVNASRTTTYSYRRKPAFWNIKGDIPPTKLWLTVITIEQPGEMFMGQKMQPICVATRKKLPNMPEFPVFGSRGGCSRVRLHRLEEPLELTPETIKLLDTFTDRTFLDVFNKHFEITYGTLRYWFAPVIDGQEFQESSNPLDVLDWELLEHVASSRELSFKPMDDPTPLKDLFFVDRVDRSRRFIVYGHVAGLKPDDPVPEHIACHENFENIRDYSYNAGKRRKWMQVKWEIPKHEPVLRAERLLHRLNYLDPPTEKDVESIYDALICPSNFIISMASQPSTKDAFVSFTDILKIPAGVVRSIIMFPSVSTRIDGYLHAWDLCKTLGCGDLDLGLALEAITKDCDNTDQPLDRQVNKQRGMGNNYERLEFLGDCYLKLGTSVSLFCESNSNDEFQLHVERMIMICNQNLFQKAKRIGVPDFIQTQGFSRRTWYPHMKLLHGKKTGMDAVKTNSHRIGDKSVADVCEALIGAALLGKGLDGATKMVSAILMSEHHSQLEFADYYRGYKKPSFQLAEPTAAQLKLADDIEAQFSYRFKSPKLLMSAFTHPSNPFTWEKVPSYQRLEFLGDSLLDLACVNHIFHAHPEADPQWLTEHKMAMVSNRFLGAICVMLGFHKRVRKMGSHMDAAINDYVLAILSAKEQAKDVSFWADLSLQSPPKVLPDVLEAFIGALFVDSEFNYSLVEGFFNDHIRPYFRDMTLYDDFAGQHPTTFLSKKLSSLGCQVWGWESRQIKTEEEAQMVAAVVIHGQVFAVRTAPSIRTARILAAQEGLKKLESMGTEEVLALCSCGTEEKGEEKMMVNESGN